MELLKFIQENINWRDLLSQAPYCLTISEDEDYVLLKYNQIESDFSHNLVKQARGIILRKIDMKPVCVPFHKFFNAGESQAVSIDWASARIESKEDGSLIKMWFDGFWHFSTNGTINAFSANTSLDGVTFGDLFITTLAEIVGDISDWEDTLDRNCTFLFELCHIINRVVILYNESKIFHIGTRNNLTFQEVNVDIGVPKPKTYSFNSLGSAILAAQELPGLDLEGYVVVDKHWNRVKIKSPGYVRLHYLINNHVITYSRVLSIVLRGEAEEVISYFPELKPYIDKTVAAYQKFINILTAEFLLLKSIPFTTRKDYAIEANKSICPAFMYMALDKGWDVDKIIPFIAEMRRETLVKVLKLKDEKIKNITIVEE